jgi:hypothetical protein
MRVPATLAFASVLACTAWACAGKQVLDLGGDAGASPASSSGGSSSGGSSSSSSGASASDDAGSDADASSGSGFKNLTLVMACTSQVFPDQVADASYFVVQASFAEDGTTGNGIFTLTDTPLALGPNNAPPTNIADTVGTPATATETVSNGAVALSLGPTSIPAAASPLGAEIDFSSTLLTVALQGGTPACATLGGSITSPEMIPMLTPSQNICVFEPPGVGGTVPTYMDSQFTSCP